MYREPNSNEYKDLQERILYEDNHLIVFNKKSGEITQGDKTGDEPLSETLKAFIAQRDHKLGKVFLGVPHRLDRPVSGVVIFAKTSKALSRLNTMLRNGELHKTYWALVCCKPPKEEDNLRHWLTKNEKNNKTYVKDISARKSGNTLSKNKVTKTAKDNVTGVVPRGYKEAHLKYKLIKTTERYYLLEIELYTGRHHQIRAQLAHIGCPIKGDLKYGAPRSNKDGSISLHARNISFVHPVSKEDISTTAPLPFGFAFPTITL